MKLQLSTRVLEAFVNSLGEEQSLELKNFVVQEFTKRHLKGVLTEELITPIKKDIESSILKLYEQEVGSIRKSYGSNYTVSLNSNLHSKIKEYIQTTVNGQLLELVKATVSEQLEDTDFNTLIETIVSEAIEAEVSRRIKIKLVQVLNGEKP